MGALVTQRLLPSTLRTQPALRIGRTSRMLMMPKSQDMIASLSVHPLGTQGPTQNDWAPAGTNGCTTPSQTWTFPARRSPSSVWVTPPVMVITTVMQLESSMIASLEKEPKFLVRPLPTLVLTTQNRKELSMANLLVLSSMRTTMVMNRKRGQMLGSTNSNLKVSCEVAT